MENKRSGANRETIGITQEMSIEKSSINSGRYNLEYEIERKLPLLP